MPARFPNGHFAGRLHGTREVGGLLLAETDYLASAHVAPHAHEHGLCSLVLEGSFTERRGRAAVTCSPGSLIYHPADEPHAHDFGAGGGRCFTVQFGAEWLARIARLGLEQPTHPTDVHRSRAGWLALGLYDEFCATDSASGLAVEGLALALLAELGRTAASVERGTAMPRWLRQVVERLEQGYLERLSLAEIAIEVQIDPTHLARSFRRHFSCTPSEYVRRRRIELATRLLLESAKPVSEIAYSTGFADQAHFTRVFRQVTGLTPAAYRRTVRGR